MIDLNQSTSQDANPLGEKLHVTQHMDIKCALGYMDCKRNHFHDINYCVPTIFYLHETHKWLKICLTIKPLFFTQDSIDAYRKLLRIHSLIFLYLGQGFYCITFFESISSNTKHERSPLDHSTTSEKFIPYLIYEILEIPWLGICKL